MLRSTQVTANWRFNGSAKPCAEQAQRGLPLQSPPIGSTKRSGPAAHRINCARITLFNATILAWVIVVDTAKKSSHCGPGNFVAVLATTTGRQTVRAKLGN
jgi:uncharacterized membrane protein